MISLYTAGPHDATLLCDLCRSTFYDTYAAYNREEDMQLFLDTHFTPEKMQEELERPGYRCFIARYEQQPAGYLHLRTGENPRELQGQNAMELGRIYVVKEMQGRGLGDLLMKKAISEAAAAGKQVLWLCVWQQNEKAIRFYRRWGFEIFAPATFLLGNDLQNDWLMKRSIDPLAEV